jgi:quercetin dioxygenase-like cupin family protein
MVRLHLLDVPKRRFQSISLLPNSAVRDVTFILYKLKDGDFEKVLGPGSAANAMKRVVVGENGEFRIGFGKMTKEPKKRSKEDPRLRPMHFNEMIYGIRGKGRVIGYSPPDYQKKEVYTVGPGDLIFMGKGSLRWMECLTDEWVTLYCAIPASSVGTRPVAFPPNDRPTK